MVQWSWEAAEAAPEAGAEAAAGTEALPGPRSRPRRSSDSGCGAEAAAGERREGEDRGRSLLAQLPKGCPAGAAGAPHRAEPEPGQRALARGGDQVKRARTGASDKQGVGGGERKGDKRGRENGRWKVKNEVEGIERQATEGKIGIALDGAHAVNSITEHMVLHTFNFYL